MILRLFWDVLHDLKPKLVIVWHKDIKNLLLRKIKEGKMPIGRSLLLIDDLGIPTKSMFRFVYNEKKSQKTDTAIIQFIKTFEQKYGRIGEFSTEQVVLRLLRWNMFKTEEDLALLTQLSVLSDDLKNMLEFVECFAWDSDVLSYLVSRIQEQLGINQVLENVPYNILHYKDAIVYSNVQLQPYRDMQVRPLVGLYPQDCSHYSLKKYEEKDLLAFTGLSFDGLRSKTFIDENVLAKGFVVYIDEEHPVSEAFFKHLFDGKLDKGSFSMIIMKSSEENDNRYLGILKDSNRLCTIKSKAIGNEAYLFIKLSNSEEYNRPVQMENKERRICNNQLQSLLPTLLNSSGDGKSRANLTGDQKAALVKHIKQLVEEKIDAEPYTIERLANVIARANICGLLSIGVNNEIRYRPEFGPKSCYRLFCYKIYSNILNDRTTRVNEIKRLFKLNNVANITDIKIEADLKIRGLESRIKLIKLCMNCSKMADFEEKIKKINKE